MIRTTRLSIRSAFARRPSPQDAASVVNSTLFGACATALNAIIYALGAIHGEAVLFPALWLFFVLTICATMARLSRKASGRMRDNISPRAARKLVLSSVLLALPWAILSIHVIGLRGGGEPLIVLMVCAGTLSGGVFMLHRAFAAALAYMATILGAVIVSIHAGGWEQAWQVSAFSLVYGAFLAFVAFKAGDTARQRDESLAALSHAVESLERAQGENHHLANIDDTTGLLNRKAFNEKLRGAASMVASDGGGFTLLLMDLDRFKNVNDLFGHGVGDELLAEIAKRLQANVSCDDEIGRLGGDEFAIILIGATDEDAIRAISARLLQALDRPAHLAGRQLHPGASIGAATCPGDATDPVDLLLKADLALNRAKETGRGQCVKFDDYLRRQVLENDEIEAGLRGALMTEQIYVEYQPKISLTSGRPVGAEALVRWRTRDGQMVPPERFLSIASERGLLPNLSRFIAETISRDILAWRGSQGASQKIALNVHPDDLKSPELFMETIQMFEERGVTSRDLVLEITEGCIIGRGTDGVNLLLDGLADRGYELSLDDFGTGHASLSHLKKVPVSEIKIDRSFISGIELRQDDLAIVSAIAEIARGMSIRSVAEGVENEGQLRILTDLGIDVGQGYLWARPMSAESFTAFMAEGARKAG